jgi:hypothetical protein
VIGFERVVSELLGDMAGGRHQLVEHGWVGNRLIGGDLDWGRPVFKGAGRNRRVAARSRFSATNTSMTCPNWSMARYRYTHRPAPLA